MLDNYAIYAALARKVLSNASHLFYANDALFPVKNHPDLNITRSYLRDRSCIFLIKYCYFFLRNVLYWVREFLNSRGFVVNHKSAKNMIISHRISNNTKPDDQYFGKLHRNLEEIGEVNVSKVYISHIKPFNHSHDTIGTSLDFKKNCHVFALILKISFDFLFNSHLEVPLRFKLHVFLHFYSPATRRAFVISEYVKKCIERSDTRRVFLTVEGHSWERYLVASLRRSNRSLLCIGYCHGAIVPSQFPIGWNLAKMGNFDYLWCVGRNSAVRINGFLEYNAGVKVIGRISQPGMWSKEHFKAPIINNLPYNGSRELVIYIILDGERSEIEAGTDLGRKIAQMYPDLPIIIKPHPVTVKNKKNFSYLQKAGLLNKNIKIMTGPFDEPFTKLVFALYRGSTGVTEAIKFGAVPVLWGTQNSAYNLTPIQKYLDCTVDYDGALEVQSTFIVKKIQNFLDCHYDIKIFQDELRNVYENYDSIRLKNVLKGSVVE